MTGQPFEQSKNSRPEQPEDRWACARRGAIFMVEVSLDPFI
jgi:hypothetical protein